LRSNLKNIDTLIFDFDGTIADTMELGIEISNRLALKYKYKKIQSKAELETYRNMKTQDAIIKIGISSLKLPIVANQFRRELSKKIVSLKPIRGVKEMLTYLANYYSMGIVTSNSSKNIHKFLVINGIENHFSFFSTGISLFKKDSNIRSLMSKNKLRKEQVLLIGDETRDIEAAREAGVMIMAVSWGFHNKSNLKNLNPDFIVDSPSDIVDKLCIN